MNVLCYNNCDNFLCLSSLILFEIKGIYCKLILLKLAVDMRGRVRILALSFVFFKALAQKALIKRDYIMLNESNRIVLRLL